MTNKETILSYNNKLLLHFHLMNKTTLTTIILYLFNLLDKLLTIYTNHILKKLAHP